MILIRSCNDNTNICILYRIIKQLENLVSSRVEAVESSKVVERNASCQPRHM